MSMNKLLHKILKFALIQPIKGTNPTVNILFLNLYVHFVVIREASSWESVTQSVDEAVRLYFYMWIRLLSLYILQVYCGWSSVSFRV